MITKKYGPLIALLLLLIASPAYAADETISSMDHALDTIRQEIAHISVQGRALTDFEKVRLKKLQHAEGLVAEARTELAQTGGAETSADTAKTKKSDKRSKHTNTIEKQPSTK